MAQASRTSTRRPDSLWEASLTSDTRCESEPWEHGLEADITIIGAGLTGLWTAYYLSGALPDAKIIVLDLAGVGFGASGRNGGWASALLPMGLNRLEREYGREFAVATQHAMHSTLDEIIRVTEAEQIDAGVTKGGTITAARSRPQLDRVRHEVETYARFGFEDDYHLLNAEEAAAICNMTGIQGALHTPHCCAVNPAQLTHGIGRAVRRRGVRIIAPACATSIRRGVVTTTHGDVRTRYVVRATEGYTSMLPGQRRASIPLYSMMVATEPLSDDVWQTIGLHDRPTFDDTRHLIIYGQRTADGRFAFGGRGAPYHFGSRIDDSFDSNEQVRLRIISTLRDLFPALHDAQFTHHWGGPLAVPRDWACGIDTDWKNGIITAGGYVGDGVSTTNLFGRIVTDLIADRELPDYEPKVQQDHLPFINRKTRRWEPEPLRWAGINGGRLAAGLADRLETRTQRPSRFFGGVIDGLLRR